MRQEIKSDISYGVRIYCNLNVDPEPLKKTLSERNFIYSFRKKKENYVFSLDICHSNYKTLYNDIIKETNFDFDIFISLFKEQDSFISELDEFAVDMIGLYKTRVYFSCTVILESTEHH
jgi:hypothetical protein